MSTYHRALALPDDIEGVARLLKLYPMLNPTGCMAAKRIANRLAIDRSLNHFDGA
ncbi:hypothetical protein [Mycobacterium leprae]|uniref:hypothetical protein n=1 Tax=Mycobacterium leprae TaxID=1769 RepID=UPI0003029699